MPRILYVITKSELGGAQSHVADLLEGFAALGANSGNRDNSGNALSELKKAEVHLATGAEGPLTARARELGAQVHLLPRLQRSVNPLVDLAAVRECAALLRRVRPDLVHAHSSKAGAVVRLAGNRTGVPVVFTAHGWGFSPGAPRARRALAWAVEAALAPLSARIICVCESDRQLALQKRVGNARTLVTVHNGIAPDAERARPDQGPPRFIMVARFNEQKDQATLLHALSLLERDGQKRDFHVDLVGTGPSFEELQRLARQLQIEDRISFLGDRDDVPWLLCASQAFILSTHYEGLPISVMEAMRAGLPVIATNVNGIPEEVAPETGLLVPPRDAPALARAIDTLVGDAAQRRRMGRKGREKFEREFTRDLMIAKVEALYRQVLNRM